MNHLNQQEIMEKYRIYNIFLTVIFLVLLYWVGSLFYKEINKNNEYLNAINQENSLRIERDENTLIFKLENDKWQMIEPFKNLASTTVIEAFFERLHGNCQIVDENKLPRKLDYYAMVRTKSNNYQIGEINQVTDMVYVKKLSPKGDFLQLVLCDKLLFSMALAPAINFIDKSLYKGDLLEIKGSFGSVNDFSGIDLSVMQVASANSEQAQSFSISQLIFVSKFDNETVEHTYKVLPPSSSDKGQHIMLFEPNKSLIYVIASNKKINAILGL